MTFAITSVTAYGIESEEAVNKRYRQFMRLKITAANTDTALDLSSYISGSLGTFWTAAGGSTVGAQALVAINDICKRATFFACSMSEELEKRDKLSATEKQVLALNSAASAGGSATETYVVTGLKTTDTILAVTNYVDGGGAAVGILSYGTAGVAAADDALVVVNNADPGSGQKIRVAVLRNAATVTPVAGQYVATIANKAPSYTFASGDAPTSYHIELEWHLTAGHPPVELVAS